MPSLEIMSSLWGGRSAPAIGSAPAHPLHLHLPLQLQDQYHEDPPEDLTATTLLHLPTRMMRASGGMTTRRSSFGLAVLEGRLLAFGGYNVYLADRCPACYWYLHLTNRYLDSVEEWVEEEEVWREREEKLALPRDFFGYATIACPTR